MFAKEAEELLIVSLFKEGDREDTGNDSAITLLSVVGRLFLMTIWSTIEVKVVKFIKCK